MVSKGILFFSFLAIFFVANTPSLATEKDPAKTFQEVSVELHACEDKKLGVKFLCSPEWELQSDQNVILIIINEKPRVTLTIARSEEVVLSLKQLTTSTLKELGQYADGFSTEMISLASEETIQVTGLSEEYPETGLLDYYLIHDLSLYSFLFSINPKGYWPAYKPLITKIRNSIEFF